MAFTRWQGVSRRGARERALSGGASLLPPGELAAALIAAGWGATEVSVDGRVAGQIVVNGSTLVAEWVPCDGGGR